MPDNRLFHRALGQSEKVNDLTDFERTVWWAYKLAADDFGVMRFSALPLQDLALWLERKPSKAVLKAFERVRDVGLVQTFDHQKQCYAFQDDWQTWQKITHPRQTKQPRPSDDVLDLNTQWLFAHHPKGAKLTSWQHPHERPKAGRIPGKDPEDSGKAPGKHPEDSRPVFVGSGSGGVRVSGGGELPAAANARSKRPIYTSDRFAVFEWQLDDLGKVLGSHLEAFDLHAFFDDLSRSSREAGLVIPRDEVWAWLQAQVLAEAKRRKLPIASAEPVRDRAAEEQAQNERVLALIQQDTRHARR